MAEERTFQIQLEGLIQLLAQNLYAEPDIFLREMIQNAHDSIKRRAELAKGQGRPEPPPAHIQVVIEPEKKEIHVIDNGSGLTDEEIDSYLATIGRSGTDELRKRIVEADRNRTIELIGQFGIGLLSAFIVADKVSVVTKAAGHGALRWESSGGRNYTVEPGHRDSVGTTVILHISSDHTRYLDKGRLQSIIRLYADFIGMPVYVNQDTEPTNAVVAPWRRTYSSENERDEAYRDFWRRKFVHEIPLHVFSVDEKIKWPDTTAQGGESSGHVRGVLAITDRHTPDVNARGTVDVYVNRMFIGADNRDILPSWAKFLQGVIECNELAPNAARDNVVRNAALVAVQQSLAERVIEELIRLSRRNRRHFTEIMRWHSYHILAMSVLPENEDFFRAVADLMPLESDQGPITVPEYLETAPLRANGSRLVYYITEPGSANQYFMLAGARSLRVFNCDEAFAEGFLKRYARLWPDRLHLVRLDVAGSETIFEPLDDEEAERFANLEAAYGQAFPDRRYAARVSRFRPSELPAVLTETRDSKSRREMAQVAGNVAMPQFLRDIVSGFLAEETEPLTLHLNASNQTIQKLATRPNLRDEVSRHALVSLYNNALMLLARTLPVESIEAMFTQHNQVIELMLLLAEERTYLERTLNAKQVELDELQADGAGPERDPYLSCFVAMPFDNPRANEIYQALRSVLEDGPYFCRVVRGDDSVETPGLWQNLKAKMQRAHFFIAVLTGPVNPNVMIEIGRMEALERPLVILHDSAAPGLPADLTGRLFGEVNGAGEGLRTQVADVLMRQQELQALKGRDRYLGEMVLMRDASLGEQASKQISRRYPSWEQFLEADSSKIASQVGVARPLIDAVKKTLKALHGPNT